MLARVAFRIQELSLVKSIFNGKIMYKDNPHVDIKQVVEREVQIFVKRCGAITLFRISSILLGEILWKWIQYIAEK